MTGTRRHRGSATVAIVITLALSLGADTSAREPDVFAGRRLADVLRTLVDRGLRIVFSSETITPSMRVVSEPPAGPPRKILDAILKPHALEAEEGPGGVIQVVRSRASRGRRPSASPGVALDRDTRAVATHSERVFVTAPSLEHGRGVERERTMSGGELQTLSGITTGDPFRAVQALPGVASAGDFHSEFSVRASPARHIGVVVGDVPMRWIRHEVYGRNDIGSVALLNPDVIEQTTLRAGAYPQRHSGHLGAELRLELRDGSRSAMHASGSIGGTYTALLAEGPIGGAGRGSWLVAARQSYRDWPLRKRTADGSVLGFTDAHARVVYDPFRGQQVSVTWLGGRTGAEGPDAAAPGGLAHATSTVSLLSAAWRSAPGDRFVLTQRVHTAAHDYRNKHPSGEDFARGADGAIGYGVDLVHSALGGVLEGGGQVERTTALRVDAEAARVSGAAWRQFGYVSLARTFAAMSLTSGISVANSTIVERPAVATWLLAEWRPRPKWTVIASTGTVSQVPEVEHLFDSLTGSPLRSERATKIDVAIERELAGSFRLRAGLFGSREHDLLVFQPDGYSNSARRSSRGFEMTLGRRGPTGLSGWVAYAYGRSRETDEGRRETYWSDFDQRHAVNLVGSYALSDRASASIILRSGSNFPVPGRLVERDGQLFTGAERNAVRLPTYARLDARAQREFDVRGQRLTAYFEVLNVLNRTNRGRAPGFLRTAGAPSTFSEPLFPRLLTAGLRIDLGSR